jgi:hypothetical protein
MMFHQGFTRRGYIIVIRFSGIENSSFRYFDMNIVAGRENDKKHY